MPASLKAFSIDLVATVVTSAVVLPAASACLAAALPALRASSFPARLAVLFVPAVSTETARTSSLVLLDALESEHVSPSTSIPNALSDKADSKGAAAREGTLSASLAASCKLSFVLPASVAPLGIP